MEPAALKHQMVATCAARTWHLSPPFVPCAETTLPMHGICCFDTTTFRLLAKQCLREGGTDVALEIGSSYGVCTQQLSDALGCPSRVVGVDTSKDLVEAASARYPTLRFERADALATPHAVVDIVKDLLGRRATANRGQQHTDITGNTASETPPKTPPAADLVVFVDIGGNRELEALVVLLPWVASALPVAPRLIVVKSEALFRAGEASGGALDWPRLQRDAAAAVAKRRGGGGGAVSTEPAAGSDALEDEVEEGPGGQEPSAKRQNTLGTQSAGQSAQSLQPAQEASTLPASKLPHPLKAKLRLNAQGVPICRFHNYRLPAPYWTGPMCRDGDRCEYDHEHCHLCGVAGHIALACDSTTARPLL